MSFDDPEAPPEVNLDGHAELYELWAEAHAKRVEWERQEKIARDLLFVAFKDIDGKAAIGTVHSKPVLRWVKVEYDTIDQAALKKHYPEIFEAFCTKPVAYEQLRIAA